MINNKTILGVIPARGGSKGIPRKNIKKLAGKPLIAWTIEETNKSKYIDRIILSTDDEEIIQVAKEWGCEVPFVRPKELAQDNTPGIETVIHAINTLEKKYDYICLLQPTSPLRTVNDIDNCIEKCVINNALSIVSVAEVAKHPYWMYKEDSNKLVPLFQNNNSHIRQTLPKVYVLNGAVYFASVEQILIDKKFINPETIFYLMSGENSFDIDSLLDFDICTCLIKRRNKV